MKLIPSLAVLVALVNFDQATVSWAASEEDGVALAVIYDTSGSMRDPVRDNAGKSSPKYIVANRALLAITRQIQTFANNKTGGASRRIDAGLFIFNGNSARAAVKFGRFDSLAFQNFAQNFSSPSGNTPLGTALVAASHAVLESPLPRKHVLVITDGMNTAGRPPSAVLPELKREAEEKHTPFSVHFVAFDIEAKLFDPVKKLGATVVAAADEPQLNEQLQFILQRKILLEEEEPPKQK